MKKLSLVVVSNAMAIALLTPVAAHADAISPGIKDKGKTYSTESPDIEMYGTGVGGRLEESSMLRFEADRLLQDADYDRAIAKIRKATQLDPACPDNHYLLAKALTKKLQQQEKPYNEKQLIEAMSEWRMIWMHDADQGEQSEAKFAYLSLKKEYMAIQHHKALEAKALEKAKKEVASKNKSNGKPVAGLASGDANRKKLEAMSGSDPSANADAAASQDSKAPSAAQPAADTSSTDPPKHKRFLIF